MLLEKLGPVPGSKELLLGYIHRNYLYNDTSLWASEVPKLNDI